MNYYSPVALGNCFHFGQNNEQYQVTYVCMTTEYNFIYATLDDEHDNTIKDVAITSKASTQPHHYCPSWYSVGGLFLNQTTGKWYMVTQIIYSIDPISKEKQIVYILRNSIGDFIQIGEYVLKERVSNQELEFVITRNKPSKPYTWDKENENLAKQFAQEPMWYNDYKKGE